jgi:hypothetical protein
MVSPASDLQVARKEISSLSSSSSQCVAALQDEALSCESISPIVGNPREQREQVEPTLKASDMAGIKVGIDLQQYLLIID